MTRQECEAKILEKLCEIAEIYAEYNPDDNYLSMTIQDGYISANNAYFDTSHKGGAIDFFYGDEDEEVYSYVH